MGIEIEPTNTNQLFGISIDVATPASLKNNHCSGQAALIFDTENLGA